MGQLGGLLKVEVMGSCRLVAVPLTGHSPVCFIGGSVVQAGVRPPPVVEVNPGADAPAGFRAGLVRVEIDTLVLQGAPQPLDNDVVPPPASAIHGDLDAGLGEGLGELQARELAALVGVEDLGLRESRQGLLKGLDAEVGIQAVREPPAEDLAAVPVHNHHQVEETATHRDVGDVGTPDFPRLVDLHSSEKVGIDPVLGMRRTGIGLLVDGREPHLTHQAANPLPANPMVLTTQRTAHQPRSVPWGLQELLVNEAHKVQILRTLPDRFVIHRGAADAQQLALPDHTEPGMAGNDLPLPSDSTHFPKAFAKKSRSTVSCPILACNSLMVLS